MQNRRILAFYFGASTAEIETRNAQRSRFVSLSLD